MPRPRPDTAERWRRLPSVDRRDGAHTPVIGDLDRHRRIDLDFDADAVRRRIRVDDGIRHELARQQLQVLDHRRRDGPLVQERGHLVPRPTPPPACDAARPSRGGPPPGASRHRAADPRLRSVIAPRFPCAGRAQTAPPTAAAPVHVVRSVVQGCSWVTAGSRRQRGLIREVAGTRRRVPATAPLAGRADRRQQALRRARRHAPVGDGVVLLASSASSPCSWCS